MDIQTIAPPIPVPLQYPSHAKHEGCARVGASESECSLSRDMSASVLLGPLTSIPSRSAQIPLDSAVTTHSRRPLVWNTVPLSIPLTWPLCTLPWEPAGHLLSVHSPRGQHEQLSQAWGRPGATALTPASALGARETCRARAWCPAACPRAPQQQALPRSASSSGDRRALAVEAPCTQKSGPFRCVMDGPVSLGEASWGARCTSGSSMNMLRIKDRYNLP